MKEGKRVLMKEEKDLERGFCDEADFYYCTQGETSFHVLIKLKEPTHLKQIGKEENTKQNIKNSLVRCVLLDLSFLLIFRFSMGIKK